MALKFSPSIRNLQGCLADPSIQHVPAFTLASAKTSLTSCLEIFEECSGKKGEDKPAALSVDFEAVTEMCKVALQNAKDVNDCLAVVMKIRNRGAE